MNCADMECLGNVVGAGWISEVCGLWSLVWSYVEGLKWCDEESCGGEVD